MRCGLYGKLPAKRDFVAIADQRFTEKKIRHVESPFEKSE